MDGGLCKYGAGLWVLQLFVATKRKRKIVSKQRLFKKRKGW